MPNARKRRAGRRQSNGPGEQPAILDGWPRAAQITGRLDYGELIRTEVSTISAEQMLGLLTNIPVRQRGYVLRRIGLGTAHKVNRGMATQVLALLARGSHASRSPLLEELMGPVVRLFDDIGEFAEDWRDLTGQDSTTALCVVLSNDTLLGGLTFIDMYVPVALFRLGLLAAIGSDSRGAAAALAFLAVENGPARTAHNELLVTHPSMPGLPEVDFSGVTLAARLRDLGLLAAGRPLDHMTLLNAVQTFTHDLDAPSPQPESGTSDQDDTSEEGGAPAMPQGEHSERDPEQDEEADPRKDLLSAIDDLEPQWRHGQEAAQRVVAALGERSAASLEDLDALTELSAEARHLASALSSLLRQDVQPTCSGLSQAAEAIRRDLAAEDTTWLQRLTHVEGPDTVDGALATIRALAAHALRKPDEAGGEVERGLRALHRLITLGAERRAGQHIGYEDIAAVEADARSALPADAQGAVLAAAFGELRIPEDPPDDSGDPPDEDPDPRPHRAEEASDGDVDLSDLDELLTSGVGTQQPKRPKPPVQASRRQPAAPIDSGKAAGGPPAASTRADVAKAESALLGQRRFGLAADLRAAGGSDRASVAARRLAALAMRLHHPTGALASAFAQEATFVKRELLADDRTGQLMAWAAAVRIAVLSPSAGAAGILADLAPCVADHPALTEVGNAFAEASRAGVIVMPEAADVASALAEAEARAAEQARAAGQLLENAAVRTIKYAPANVVYQAWMSVTGTLGGLLRQVADNDHSRADSMLDAVVELRGQAEKMIDETFAAQRQRNLRVKIIAGPRATLRQRYLEVIDTVAAWAEAAKEASADPADAPRQAWQATPLARLRSRLAEVRAEIVPALDLLRAESGNADVATAVLNLISSAQQTCDGRPPRGPEVSPAYALHEELLASDLPLNPSALTPDDEFGADVLPALLRLARAPAALLPAVYDTRARAGDHDLTAVLIDAARTFDPETAEELRQRRGRDVAEFGPLVASEVAAITSKIDARRMASTLDDQAWSVLASRAERLSDPTRRDYGRIRGELKEIDDELDKQRREMITAALERINAYASTTPEVAAVAGILVNFARSGQVSSAEECLEQVLIGETLPTETADADHFTRFFPAVPDACESHPDLLSRLRTALKPAGEDSPRTPPALRTLEAATGVDPATLSRPRAESGSRAIGAWLALRDRSQRTEISGALHYVLAEAGLEFEHATVKQGSPAGRAWISLDGVRGTGRALTPVLGSAMSPSGDTLRLLLIWSSVSPATVVEWMSEEPDDQTVLAIWLPGPLSAAERRSLADASRGRPRPPLLLLDDAALAYLVVQAEPRRSTFAEISLPFTAVSPYRDTPGYTAPEMFYGRTEELAAIKDLTGSSIVYGGRQLGKSALLKTAQRQFDDGVNRRAVLTSIFTIGGDADPERVWSALWPHLAELGIAPRKAPDGDLAEAVHRAIVEWTGGHPGRALLVLLDEADAFLEADAAANRFTNVDWCRRIMLDTERRAKFVFAGLHRTARFDSLPNQPLAHFGQPVSVGPLHPQAAHDLLARPLAAMGFRFEDPDAIPARVLALANNMPALLQLFGVALIAHLTSRPMPPDSPPTAITGEDIDEVFADAKLRDAFREKYIHTLNLDHRYLVIAYVVAYAAHQDGTGRSVTLAELSNDARQAWPAGFAKCGADDFRSLVTECVDLRVLAVDNGGYRIRTPNVLRLLGTEEEVFETLSTAPERLHVQSPADGAAYRRRIRGGQKRMPLTERQIGEVFKARDRVLVISGSQALGIERVLSSVVQAEQEGHSRLNVLQRLSTQSPAGLQRAVSMLTDGHALIAADLRKSTATTVKDMLATAKKAVDQHAGPLTVVLVAGSGTAPAWIGHDDRIDLDLVDEVGLRLWSDEDNLPFRDDQVRRRLLAETGGWPILLARIAEAAHTGDPVTAPEDMLADLTDWISSPSGAATLVKAAGLRSDAEDPVPQALATVFGLAAELTANVGEPREDLAELLVMYTPELPASLRRAGFDGLAQAIDALIALSCIAVDDSGLLQTEAVLTRAFRTVTPELI